MKLDASRLDMKAAMANDGSWVERDESYDGDSSKAINGASVSRTLLVVNNLGHQKRELAQRRELYNLKSDCLD